MCEIEFFKSSVTPDTYYCIDKTKGQKGLIEVIKNTKKEKSICYFPYKQPFIKEFEEKSQPIKMATYLAVRGFVMTVLFRNRSLLSLPEVRAIPKPGPA